MLEFPRVILWRFFNRSDRYGSLCESHRTWPIRSAVADVGPSNFTGGIDDIGNGRGNGPGPVTFVLVADRADQDGIRIGEKSYGIWIEWNMWTVFLAIARYALA